MTTFSKDTIILKKLCELCNRSFRRDIDIIHKEIGIMNTDVDSMEPQQKINIIKQLSKKKILIGLILDDS